jgi:uncharacterized membrane protein YhaH (DUF805 family)
MESALSSAQLGTLFFALEGRISPRAWRWGMVAVFTAFLLVDAALRALVGTSGTTSRMLRFLAFILFLYPFVALCAKRFVDRGRPGEWALLVALPSALHGALAAGGMFLPVSKFGITLGSMIGSALGLIVAVGFAWFLFELGYLPAKAAVARVNLDRSNLSRERQLTHGARLP